MEFTKESLKNLIKKRNNYMKTALSVYEKNTDESGDFKNQSTEIDFLGLLQKINDTYDGIQNMAKAVEPDNDYSFMTKRMSGIEGLKAAIEIEASTPVNKPLYAPIGNHGTEEEGKGVCLTAESKKFSNMFGGRSLSNGGFKNFNDYLKTVHSGRYDERLGSAIKAAMTEGVPSQGGFAVPEEYAATLLDNSLESEIVRPRAQVWPMKAEVRKIPAWDGNNHSSSLFGGLSGVWLGEGKTATRQQGKLRLMQLTAHKLACFSQASNELLADGMNFEAQLGNAMIKSTSWSMDYAFINGDGAGKPLGMLKDPAIITVSPEAGQAAGSVVYENLIKMFARLAPQCMKNAVWIANPTTIPGLLTLCVPIGTSGSAIPVMSESNGQFKVLTIPIIFTEKVPSVGNEGDISLVDWSQYAIGLRKEISLDKSNAPGWTEDMTDYRTILRVDGQGTWDKPITPKNGDTLSWCITLEAR